MASTVVSDEAGPNGSAEPPALAVTVAIILFILSLLVLLFFVHKMAHSITTDAVVRSIWMDLKKATRENVPKRGDENTSPPPPVPNEVDRLAIGEYG